MKLWRICEGLYVNEKERIMKNIQERNNQNPFLEGKLIFPAHLNQMAEEKMFRTWDLVMVFLATGSFSSKKSGMTGPARQWNALISWNEGRCLRAAAFAAEKRVHKAIKIGYSERSISIFYKDAA